ncbi:MAG: hypothetical protein ACFWUG_06330 [Rahnella inusitata]|jgi:hypothetical protein
MPLIGKGRNLYTWRVVENIIPGVVDDLRPLDYQRLIPELNEDVLV